MIHEHPQTDAPCSAAKKTKRVWRLAAFEGILLLSRWLQVPLLIGLIIALVVFEIKFAEHLIDTLTTLK